eukprot:15345391-Ditylum_brightwellii.AAC.1
MPRAYRKKTLPSTVHLCTWPVVIELLLEYSEEASAHQDNWWCILLHYALLYYALVDLAMALLMASPNSTSATDKD